MEGFEVSVGLSVQNQNKIKPPLSYAHKATLWAGLGGEELVLCSQAASANAGGFQGLLRAETNLSDIKQWLWEHDSVFRSIRELGRFYLCQSYS